MSDPAKEVEEPGLMEGDRLTAPCWWCSVIFPGLLLLLVLVALISVNVN